MHSVVYLINTPTPRRIAWDSHYTSHNAHP